MPELLIRRTDWRTMFLYTLGFFLPTIIKGLAPDAAMVAAAVVALVQRAGTEKV